MAYSFMAVPAYADQLPMHCAASVGVCIGQRQLGRVFEVLNVMDYHGACVSSACAAAVALVVIAFEDLTPFALPLWRVVEWIVFHCSPSFLVFPLYSTWNEQNEQLFGFYYCLQLVYF